MGRDLPKPHHHQGRQWFQSTRPRGARPALCVRLLGVQSFNPRARVGRDILHNDAFLFIAKFQSTRPRGARLNIGHNALPVKRCFNPRARVGRDFCWRHSADCYGCVSIHAPAWGATHNTLPSGKTAKVSIHAPAWGATQPTVGVDDVDSEFQSTRPRGARPSQADRHRRVYYVSIHAPAWGATRWALIRLSTIAGFNPRARVGRDLTLPTPPSDPSSFNPRARVGRDSTLTGGYSATAKFQSTRPRGARPLYSSCCRGCSKFQSTRPRGARPSTDFISPPPRSFQSTRPRGARHYQRQARQHIFRVSIHAPAWGATK